MKRKQISSIVLLLDCYLEPKRAQPDLQVAVAYLCVPKYPNQSDYRKLTRVIKYLRLTAFKQCSHIWKQKRGPFTGVFLPQKSVLLPPIKTQYKPFQKHVTSY
jgi:hypothetical protein